MKRSQQQPQQPSPGDVLITLADELTTHRPNQPADRWAIRGRARAHGLSSDNVDLLLPTADEGTPRYEYAHRLREIARAN